MDSGTGPGMSSRILLSSGFEKVVGLDPSSKLLKDARSLLGGRFYPVVGTAENLPFRSNCFGCVLTCFALRDVRDPIASLREFARTVRANGMLAVVDIGKPDSSFWRLTLTIYIRLAMPLLSKVLIRNRMRGNPFRMIVPTFQQLSTNHDLTSRIANEFGPSKLREFMLGGLVIIEAERASR